MGTPRSASLAARSAMPTSSCEHARFLVCERTGCGLPAHLARQGKVLHENVGGKAYAAAAEWPREGSITPRSLLRAASHLAMVAFAVESLANGLHTTLSDSAQPPPAARRT
jgi:hypothetical protein